MSTRTEERRSPGRASPGGGGGLAGHDAFARGMWPEALVAALATLAVAWPLTALLREGTWMAPAAAMVLLVAVSGGLMRTIDLPPSIVALGQLLLGLGGLVAIYLRETLWRGVLPTADTVDRVLALLQQAGSVLQTYAAPAPTTEGVSFLVVSVITLTAISVDSMGVTGRAPASAGIPLAAAFLVSVSNTGRAMAPWFFIAVAVLWLMMLAQQSQRVTASWSSANRQESRGGADVSSGPRTHRGLAQVLGAGTLIAAILGASTLPHLPPTFLGDGLARDPDARTIGGSQAAGEVSFTETMDPSQDLRNRSDAPVLRYRTDAPGPEPLRVTATERFADGQWQSPDRLQAELLPLNAPPPEPPGRSPQIASAVFTAEVVDNELSPPHLATPSPLVDLDLAGGDYRFDPNDATVVLQGRSPAYTASFVVPSPGQQLPPQVGTVPADPGAFGADLLEVDAASAEAIAALSEQVVGEETNALQAAIAMQTHFRAPGAYVYSLELAPAAEVGAADPISAFIESRRGYCVQFAQTMVMMARHEGIPARMAVGFLPGTAQPDGSRTVVAADAHTWPELWISGLGWTRFEPTPGARAPSTPPWTQAQQADEVPPVTATPSPQPAPDPTVPEPTAAPEAPAEDGLLDRARELLPTIGAVLLAALVLAALMTVVPLLGRRFREAGLREATTPGERVEGQWLLLTRALQDYGIDEPPPRSPRVMASHYDRTLAQRLPERAVGGDSRGPGVSGGSPGSAGADAALVGAGRSGGGPSAGGARAAGRGGAARQEALGRVTATLERSRYAAPASLSDEDASLMGEDVRAVVDSARRSAPWNLRANARLLPRSGLTALREALTFWRP